MPTQELITIGYKRSSPGNYYAEVGEGQIRAYVPNEIAADCWIHTAKVWMGRATSETPWVRPIVYNAQGYKGQDGPTSIICYFEPINPSKAMFDASGGQLYSSPISGGRKGAKGTGGDWIALSLHGRNAMTHVGESAASEITGDNEKMYDRYGYTSTTPPTPMGAGAGHTEGWLVYWLEADKNLPPLAPTGVGPTGNISTVTPTIVADFRDPNGANGGGIDRGDLMSAVLIQVRRKVDQVTFWNVEYAASEAERTANQSAKVYGSVGAATALVRGITYQARVAHKDDRGALGPYSSWVDFTPNSQGIVTIPATNGVKLDALQPSVPVKWDHQTALATNAVQVQILKGGVIVRDSGIVARAIASGATDTLTWAILGLTGNLEDGAGHTAIVQGRDTAGIWSGYSSPWSFVTDKAPGIPVSLSPTGNIALPSSSYPKLYCTVVDPDDTPATGLVVKAEILTQAGSLISTRTMSLVAGTTDLFVYQTTGSDLASVGNYKFRCYAGDGYLWSGVTTVEASATRSVESLFQWKAVPAVTLVTPASSSSLNDDTPDLTWTVSAQDKYRIRALDSVSGAEVYNSGWIVNSVTRTAPIPVGWTKNGGLYNFEIGVEASSLQGFAVATNVLIAYTPPPTLSNFTVLPEVIGNDPFPTSARISFDAYTGSGFAGYLIERSDLPRPLMLETAIGQTALSDFHVPAQPVVYTGRVIEARGIDEYVLSNPVSITFALDMNGVALVSLTQPLTQRFVTAQRGKRSWKPTGEETTFLPRGADAPISKTGRARWWEGDLAFVLRRELADPEDDRAALVALAQSGQGFSYRDRRHRYFMRIPVADGLSIEDVGGGGYDVSAKVRSVLHNEGVTS